MSRARSAMHGGSKVILRFCSVQCYFGLIGRSCLGWAYCQKNLSFPVSPGKVLDQLFTCRKLLWWEPYEWILWWHRSQYEAWTQIYSQILFILGYLESEVFLWFQPLRQLRSFSGGLFMDGHWNLVYILMTGNPHGGPLVDNCGGFPLFCYLQLWNGNTTKQNHGFTLDESKAGRIGRFCSNIPSWSDRWISVLESQMDVQSSTIVFMYLFNGLFHAAGIQVQSKA